LKDKKINEDEIEKKFFFFKIILNKINNNKKNKDSKNRRLDDHLYRSILDGLKQFQCCCGRQIRSLNGPAYASNIFKEYIFIIY
jgi:hypothetical protein